MFSKAFGYALRAVTGLARLNVENRKIGLQELSERLAIPRPFLGKIMQDLVRHGVVDSLKGPTGGFFINSKTLDMKVIDILKITDGLRGFDTCALGMTECSSSKPCPLHHEIAACRSDLLRTFHQKTVGMLLGEVERGETFLQR